MIGDLTVEPLAARSLGQPSRRGASGGSEYRIRIGRPSHQQPLLQNRFAGGSPECGVLRDEGRAHTLFLNTQQRVQKGF